MGWAGRCHGNVAWLVAGFKGRTKQGDDILVFKCRFKGYFERQGFALRADALFGEADEASSDSVDGIEPVDRDPFEDVEPGNRLGIVSWGVTLTQTSRCLACGLLVPKNTFRWFWRGKRRAVERTIEARCIRSKKFMEDPAEPAHIGNVLAGERLHIGHTVSMLRSHLALDSVDNEVRGHMEEALLVFEHLQRL